MPADNTMGGEHPLVAIKRLAHWEVEDDLQMLRTRLACINAQVDKVSPADRAALVARLRREAHDFDAAYRTPEDGPSWVAELLLEAADALTATPEAPSGWQPIDTAPPGLADGKWTYVLFSGYSKGGSFSGRAVVSGWMGKTHNGRYEPVHNYSYKLVITHWRPMPANPGAGTAGDYTPAERDCHGCTGPCGRCHEAHPLTPEQVKLHEQYVVDHAGDHDDDCPGDDTCECSMRARNEAVSAVCRYLAGRLP